MRRKAISILEGIRSHYPLLGPRGLFLLAKGRLLGRPVETKVLVPGIEHPVHLRLGTSDISLFRDILLNKEYEWNLPTRPRVIVDAGANIGLASVFYATRYPEAKIISIEPEPANARMLRKNMSYYPNSTVIEAALWGINEDLQLVDPGLGEWGFRTVSGLSNVRGLTVDQVMRRSSIKHIDLLKIDIEGAEKEVFEHSSMWIDQVGALVIELHDRFKDGCSSSLYSATRDFRCVRSKGESLFFIRSH